ncbi:tyrosine--tRNA ligase [Candidatus Parcubacteria bacterium]|nr:tyrosine--tRNA ligase [Candidatus Parcubacteria bacterium]
MAKVITDKNRIQEVLTRGVEEVIVKEHLEKALLSGKPLRVKFGIDPTGPKIHIGRAISLWKLRALQDLGHKIVLIIGDFTAQIGDASDKQAMRKCLTEKEIKENMRGYLEQIEKIVNLKKAEIHYNSEWLDKITWREGLRISMNFTSQQVIQRRNFKERWDNAIPIGIHELSYPLLQGYDSVAIKADLELGGFDQLFNLKTGRKMQTFFKQKPQDIMTLKMLYGLDGRKMSTSWGNVVNITEKPQEMFGKIMSIKDELIKEYFELTTALPLEEIRAIVEKNPNPKDQKVILGLELVKMYHGEKEAIKAEEEFEKVFKQGELPSEMPIFKAEKEECSILDLLFEAGLAKSKSEAKRLIESGAIKINQAIKQNWREIIHLKNGDVLQAGKRKFVKIKLSEGEQNANNPNN